MQSLCISTLCCPVAVMPTVCRLRPIMACCWSRFQMHAGISPAVLCWVERARQCPPQAASRQSDAHICRVLGSAPIGLDSMWLVLFRPINPGLRILCATFRAPYLAQPFSTPLVHIRGPKIDDPAWVGLIHRGDLGRRVRVRLEAMAVYSVTVVSSGRLQQEQQSNETRQAASRGRKRKIQLPAAWCALPGCITTGTLQLQEKALRLKSRSQPLWVTQFPTFPFALPKGPIRYMTRRFERAGPGDGYLTTGLSLALPEWSAGTMLSRVH